MLQVCVCLSYLKIFFCDNESVSKALSHQKKLQYLVLIDLNYYLIMFILYKTNSRSHFVVEVCQIKNNFVEIVQIRDICVIGLTF